MKTANLGQDHDVGPEAGIRGSSGRAASRRGVSPPTDTFVVGAPTSWQGGAAHPAPRRLIFITLQGEYEVKASDGSIRQFPVESVLSDRDYDWSDRRASRTRTTGFEAVGERV